MLQVPQVIPAVWVYSTAPALNALRPEGFAAFLTDPMKARLERIRQSRLLFDGLHRKYFVDEGRTQFEFSPVRASGVWGEKTIQMYLECNMLDLIAKKSADLMFGDEPLLRIARPVPAKAGAAAGEDAPGAEPDPQAAVLAVADAMQREKLAQLAERSNLHTLFHTKAVDASYEAEAFLESSIADGQVYLQDVPADEIFTIGRMGADHQHQQYQRLQLKNAGTREHPVWLLLRIHYFPGRIERHLWQLDDHGNVMPRELALDQWPLDVGEPPLAALTTTGIAENTITYVPNQLSRGVPLSDYDGLIDLQDTLNAKQTQMARVLAAHADPKLAMPSRMANEQGGVRSQYGLFFFDDPAEKPSYITWNAELEHALTDREFTREQLLLKAEMAPTLLGIQKHSSRASSYKAVRLEAYNSLTKAQRKAMYWKSGIRRALRICQMLENTLPGVRYDIGPIGVELKDGIPQDELDQANRISILRAAGVMSLKRAVAEQLNGDPAAMSDELAEIEQENASKSPSILFAPPAPPKGLQQQPPADEDSAAGVAAEQDAGEVAA